MNADTGWLEHVRAAFLADQAEAAQEDATARFAALAGARGTNYARVPSPWLLRLVRRARRHRCGHQPQEGRAVVFLPAHLPRLECGVCARKTAERLEKSPDQLRCDLCRDEARLEPFAFQVSSLLVTGRCCQGCRATVYGGQQ